MTTLVSDIDVLDHGATVAVALQVGHIQGAQASVALRGHTSTTEIANPMIPDTLYSLNPAANLVRRQVLVCVAYLTDAAGGGPSKPYFAVCNFYQGGIYLCSSKTFSGTYQEGQAIAAVTFLCSFS